MSNFTLPAKVTLVEAGAVLAQLASYQGAEWEVDAGALAQFDSSALSVLLQARRQGARRVVNAPPKLAALAQMYGVAEVLAL